MMTMMDFEDVMSMVGTGWTVLADEDGESVVVKACPPRQNPDTDGWYIGKGESVSDAVVSLIDGLAACGWTVNRSTAPHRGPRDDFYRRALNAAVAGNTYVAAVAFRRAADGDDPAYIEAAARGIRWAIDAVRVRSDADRRLIDVMDDIVRDAEAALPVTQPQHHPVRVFEEEEAQS